MEIVEITPFLSVSAQPAIGDLKALADLGIRSIINNRPDGETDGQPDSAEVEQAALELGISYHHLPVVPGQISDQDVLDFSALLSELTGPVLAFCRTGTRAISLWALNEAKHLDVDVVLATAKRAGYDLENLVPRLAENFQHRTHSPYGKTIAAHTYDVVIVGGGAGGAAVAASLSQRRSELDIVVVEPRTQHYYQPGWTMVGAGVFGLAQTERPLSSVLPAQVKRLHSAVAGFEPTHNRVVLEDGERLRYRALVVAPGLQLNWHAIEGLPETLGHNQVTSNYSYDTAPYTWSCVRGLQEGRALFSQPPMPIKCAGAPQKVMYLSCDHWKRQGRLQDIEVEFHNAGQVLFGVDEYLPALKKYIARYGIDEHYQSNLVAVDGASGKAWFQETGADGATRRVEKDFGMLHVSPPQGPQPFMLGSPIANAEGWTEVDASTLQHTGYPNVFGIGDANATPNAKTAAAVRKQAPVVAENLLATLDGLAPNAAYDGYGSCPLTVERGKVVLAEFGYGGALQPTFPSWLLDGTRPSRLAWFFKERMLPPIYWQMMLKGREWLAEPQALSEDAAVPHIPGTATVAASIERRG